MNITHKSKCLMLWLIFLNTAIFALFFYFLLDDYCLEKSCDDYSCIPKDKFEEYFDDTKFTDMCTKNTAQQNSIIKNDIILISYDCYCLDTGTCKENHFKNDLQLCSFITALVAFAITICNS